MNIFKNYDLNRTSNSKNTTNFNLFVQSPKNYSNFSKTSTSTLPHKDTKHKIETTDVQAFCQLNEIALKSNQVECLRLIELTPSKGKVNIEQLNQLDFSVLSYKVPQLVQFSKMIFQINPERKAVGKAFNLNRLIELIAQNYNVTAYHNFSHAFSVLLLLHQSYNRSDTLRKSLTQKQWFYVYVAALAHDLNHPGTTNAFQVKCKSQFAIDAQNESVLQKMHLSVFWNILKRNSQINFLQGYSYQQSSQIKKLITRMILATDITKHFKGLDSLKTTIKLKKICEGETSLMAMQQLFHACDIGNPCLDYDNYINWSALVSYEFNQVTKREEELGLSVTTFLKYENMNKFYGGQVGFCKGLVLPLWKQLEVVYPGLAEMSNNIVSNMRELQKKKHQQ